MVQWVQVASIEVQDGWHLPHLLLRRRFLRPSPHRHRATAHRGEAADGHGHSCECFKTCSFWAKLDGSRAYFFCHFHGKKYGNMILTQRMKSFQGWPCTFRIVKGATFQHAENCTWFLEMGQSGQVPEKWATTTTTTRIREFVHRTQPIPYIFIYIYIP